MLKGIVDDPLLEGGHEGNKGALRMGMWVRVKRGLVVVGLLLALGLAGFAPGAALAAAKHGSEASTIVVEGNRRVDTDTVRSYFKAGPGGHLDAAAINAGIKALYASGLFEDIHISQQGERLVVSVVEAPVIDRVAFEGNYRMKDEQAAAGDPVEGARHAVASHGAAGRPAHR